jgi:Glycosyltransferases involved in cell wall biogenesis
MTKKISLIIPAKNEVESLETVLLEVQKNYLIGEIIVVVDSEFDNSVVIAKKFNCKLVIQKNNGYGSAIIEGFKNAKNEFGCIFNADHSFDPKYLDGLVKESEKKDFVFGTRYNKLSGSDDDTIVTLIGNKIFSFITNKILKIKLTDILFTYVLCNVEKFNKLNLKNHDFKLCIELPAKVKQKNFSYSEIPIFERKRYGGKKKVNAIKDGFLILIEIIKNFGK